MTTNQDIDSLISSTLDALDMKKEELEPTECALEPEAKVMENQSGSSDNSSGSNENDVEELLSKLSKAAPKVDSERTGGSEADLAALLEGMLTPESIVDSMESLAEELEKFLNSKQTSSADTPRYRKQLDIYKDVSAAYKVNPNILEDPSPEGERVRARLAELQSLGSPPPEVVEKLMMGQLPCGEDGEDLAKEFESFLKEAGDGGLLPGLTKEDEEMIKKLTQDPNALKTLLSDPSGKPPTDCSVM
jgi:hypothetical protein